jgi:tetratricopeptide (TPR) repeat protein
LGRLYRDMKDYDKALELSKRSVQRQEKAGAEKASMNFMVIAGTYDDMGRHNEAVEWYERCLAGREAVLGKNHKETLFTVAKLAAASKKAGGAAMVEALRRKYPDFVDGT